MTTGPLAGPASAYPTVNTPASICLRGANEVFVPGLIGLILLDCAPAEPIIASLATARVRTVVPKRRRRSRLISSDIPDLLNRIQWDVVDCRVGYWHACCPDPTVELRGGLHVGG